MDQGFMNGAGRGLYGGLTSKASPRMPIRPVAQIAGVVVSRWRTLIRAAAGREYILRDVHWCVTEPVSKLSREMCVATKAASVSNLAEVLICGQLRPAMQKTCGLI